MCVFRNVVSVMFVYMENCFFEMIWGNRNVEAFSLICRVAVLLHFPSGGTNETSDISVF